MKEQISEYRREDEDGNNVKFVFVHRFCGCEYPGCVDDELAIFEPGEDVPMRMSIPREMTSHIERLFEKDECQ